jgi:zinc ribbon protein
MLHCVKCGTVLPEDATLCSNCGYPVNQAEDLTAAETEAINRKKYSAIPAAGYGHHVKMWFPVVLAILATAALYVGLRRKSDPSGIEIVKRHFVFYDDYSHGAWQHTPCQAPDHSSCVEVTYTVPVQACGPVKFSWRVFPSEDDLEYQGAMPRVNETRYAFYSFLVKETGALIPAQAYGKPVPDVCQYR